MKISSKAITTQVIHARMAFRYVAMAYRHVAMAYRYLAMAFRYVAMAFRYLAMAPMPLHSTTFALSCCTNIVTNGMSSSSFSIALRVIVAESYLLWLNALVC